MTFRIRGELCSRSIPIAGLVLALALPVLGDELPPLPAPSHLAPTHSVPGAVIPDETAPRAAIDRSVKAGPPFLFAIIGQVARPGVYRAPIPVPYLEDLVHNAGGLTGDASGYLRIIRRGPEGFEARFATNPEVQLRPGDVVVAERKSSLVIEPRTVPTAAGDTADTENTPPTEHVQLAFVNLLDRPIVLKMRRSEATLSRILELLGQRGDLDSTVQVISPADVPPPALDKPRLISGTVLVFDRSVLEVDRIPQLPLTIANDKPKATQQTQPATKQTEPAAGESTATAAKKLFGMVHKFPFIAPGHQQSPQLGNPPRLDADPLDATEAAAGTAKEFATPQTGQASGVTTTPPEPKASETNAGRMTFPFPTGEPVVPAEGQKTAVSRSSWFGGIGFATLCAGLIAVSAWVLLLVVRRRAKSRLAALPRSPAPAITPPEAGDLDEIINNELLLVEEPVQFPKPLQLFARPYGQPKTRLDAEHAPRRPHFLPETPQPRETPLRQQAPLPQETRLEQQTPVQQPAAARADTVQPPLGGEQVRFDAGRAPETVPQAASAQQPAPAASAARSVSRPGLLDRVLSNVHGATRP